MRCVKCDLAYSTHGMYRLHMQQYHEKALTCEECGKKFTLPNSLNKHRLNYHTSFPKTCDDCGQFCATKEEFISHLANAHGQGVQENTVPCEVCGKLVKNKYVLKQHVRLVHERKGGEFPCDQCGKIMKSKASLEYHSKVHTGDYAFRYVYFSYLYHFSVYLNAALAVMTPNLSQTPPYSTKFLGIYYKLNDEWPVPKKEVTKQKESKLVLKP